MEFYAEVFQTVRVLLHPFIRPIAISTDRFTPATYPDRRELRESCQAVSWAEIQRLSGFDSLGAVDVALRTQIGGLKAEFANQSLARALHTTLSGEGIIPPNEGTFSDLSHEAILSFIQSRGYTWVWIGDEFCTERKLHWIEDLKAPDSHATEGHRSVFTPDKKILWTNHWDSHFAFFCSTEAITDALSREEALEGFQCSPHTEVYWSVRP